jgi:hypothetical protein
LASLQTFNLVARQDNHWQLTIPDEFWTQARAEFEHAEQLSQETPTAPASTY